MFSFAYDRERGVAGEVAGAPDVQGAKAVLTVTGSAAGAGEDAWAGSHFLRFAGSKKSGHFYPVIGNTAGSVTISIADADLVGVESGDDFEVVPFWTLASAFPPGAQNVVHASGGLLPTARRTELHLYRDGSGIDRAPGRVFFLTADGWREQVRDLPDADDTILPPGSVLVLRQDHLAAAANLVVHGAVVGTSQAVSVRTQVDGPRDNFVGLPHPVPVALSDLRWENFAESSSTDAGDRADEVLRFDQTMPAPNRRPEIRYFRLGGEWRKDEPGFPDVSHVLFSPGEAVVVRKVATVDAGTFYTRTPELLRSLSLANSGFENGLGTQTGLPGWFGAWQGSHRQAVGEESGITPHDGGMMLKFLASGPDGPAEAPADTVTSAQWQLVDLQPVLSLVRAGEAKVDASAYFNRVAGDGNTDDLFRLSVHAMSGQPLQFAGGVAALRSGFERELLADADPATWESINVGGDIPSDSRYLAVGLHAVENRSDDAVAPEFDGHYADAVSLVVSPRSGEWHGALENGGFDQVAETIASGLPASTAVWAGDAATLASGQVAEIRPHRGRQMLRLQSTTIGDAETASVWQLVDIRDWIGANAGAGRVLVAGVEGKVNRIGGPQVDTRFDLEVRFL